MKKYLLVLALIVLVITPVVSQSFSLSELYAQIAQIQAQIAALQNQSTPDCPFVRDLSLGDGPSNGRQADVVMLQKWLLEDYLIIPRPTGYFGTLTLSALKRWQRDNNLAVTGRFGLNERLILCGRNDNESNAITIDSVSGPTSIGVNQTGTWQVKVTAPADTNLTYSVDWGDNRVSPQVSGSSVSGQGKQTSTFTHTYSQAGTYTVKFIVKSFRSVLGNCPSNVSCDPVENRVETSMTVVVGGVNNNLTITCPADPANWHDYVGGNYSKVFSVTRSNDIITGNVVNMGGVPVYSWSIANGSLPPGLSLDYPLTVCTTGYNCYPDISRARVSGIPTRAGHFPFVLTVRDNSGNTGSLNVYIDIE